MSHFVLFQHCRMVRDKKIQFRLRIIDERTGDIAVGPGFAGSRKALFREVFEKRLTPEFPRGCGIGLTSCTKPFFRSILDEKTNNFPITIFVDEESFAFGLENLEP